MLCLGAALLAAWLASALFSGHVRVGAQVVQPPAPQPPLQVNLPINLPVNTPITSNNTTQPPVTVNTPTSTNTPAPAPTPAPPPAPALTPTPKPATSTSPTPAPAAPTPSSTPAPRGLSLRTVVDRIVGPIAAGLALLNLLLATTVGTWYPLLLRIFLEPLQLFSARRRHRWGVVYNSLTKAPIDLAIVRLYHVDGRLARTTVTDRAGRYGFLVDQPATYRIEVSKADYQLSTLLGGKRADEHYANIYTGGTFTLTEPTFVHYNLPLDHEHPRYTVQQLLRRHYRRVAHLLVTYGGVAVGLVAFALTRTRLSLSLLALHVLVLLIFYRVAVGSRARPWGVVYDSRNDHPLPHSVVRIFDTRYGRLLESQVADRFARYGFLVGPGSYRLDAVRTGYRFPSIGKVRSRDYIGTPIRRVTADGVVALNIPLDPLLPLRSQR